MDHGAFSVYSNCATRIRQNKITQVGRIYSVKFRLFVCTGSLEDGERVAFLVDGHSIAHPLARPSVSPLPHQQPKLLSEIRELAVCVVVKKEIETHTHTWGGG